MQNSEQLLIVKTEKGCDNVPIPTFDFGASGRSPKVQRSSDFGDVMSSIQQQIETAVERKAVEMREAHRAELMQKDAEIGRLKDQLEESASQLRLKTTKLTQIKGKHADALKALQTRYDALKGRYDALENTRRTEVAHHQKDIQYAKENAAKEVRAQLDALKGRYDALENTRRTEVAHHQKDIQHAKENAAKEVRVQFENGTVFMQLREEMQRQGAAHATEIKRLRLAQCAELEKAKKGASESRQAQEAKHRDELDRLRAECNANMEQLKIRHQARLDQLKNEYRADVDRVKIKHDAQVKTLRDDHARDIENMRLAHQSLSKVKDQSLSDVREQLRLREEQDGQTDQWKRKAEELTNTVDILQSQVKAKDTIIQLLYPSSSFNQALESLPAVVQRLTSTVESLTARASYLESHMARASSVVPYAFPPSYGAPRFELLPDRR